MTHTVHTTVNLPSDKEYDNDVQINVELINHLKMALELPDNWTSIVVVITNPEEAA